MVHRDILYVVCCTFITCLSAFKTTATDSFIPCGGRRIPNNFPHMDRLDKQQLVPECSKKNIFNHYSLSQTAFTTSALGKSSLGNTHIRHPKGQKTNTDPHSISNRSRPNSDPANFFCFRFESDCNKTAKTSLTLPTKVESPDLSEVKTNISFLYFFF